MESNYVKEVERVGGIKIRDYNSFLKKTVYNQIEQTYNTTEEKYAATLQNFSKAVGTDEQMYNTAEKAYIDVYKKFANFSIEAAYAKAISAYNETEALKNIFSTISDMVKAEYEQRRGSRNNIFEFARNICIDRMKEYCDVEQAQRNATTAYDAFKSSKDTNICIGDVESIVDICENAFNKANTLTIGIKLDVEIRCFKALREAAEKADSKTPASK